MRQLTLNLPSVTTEFIPTTRYQGSKARLVRWIWKTIQTYTFDTVLDAFGGTGVVGYWLKQKGKQVTYNDFLRFNYLIGVALIENSSAYLEEEEIESIIRPHPNRTYRSFIADTFRGIYYTDEENRWLDIAVQNILSIKNRYKQAMAFYALFQACLVKRPFNLFHRKNLYLRLANVRRTFGNKTTWDTPFEAHFRRFAHEINLLVVDNGRDNLALNKDVLKIEGNYDLVYIDPPYIPSQGRAVDYHHFYHFLEGLARYDEWPALIDYDSKHLRMKPIENPWTNPSRIHEMFARLFDHFHNSILVVSYRAGGIPSISELERLLRQVKRRVVVRIHPNFQYALSPRRTTEVLLIGE